MRRALFLLALGVAIGAATPAAQALGFGRSSTTTTLGQQLDFVATVHLDADETIGRGCVSADVTAGDARLAPGGVITSLEPAADPRLRNVRVRTMATIAEPIVTVEVHLGCGSQLSRRFVSFIDPPLLGLAQTTASADAGATGAADEPRAVVVAAPARPHRADRAAPSGARRPASAHRADRRAARRPVVGHRMAVAAGVVPAGAERPHRPATRVALDAAGAGAAAGGHGARLRLEAPTQPAAASAPAASNPTATEPGLQVAAASPASAEPAGDAASAALAREHERIQLLETGLARLRTDSQATQRTVAALQARLRQAEGERYANWLVFTLAGLAALLALLAAALWWLRPRQRRHKRWFDAAASQQAAAQRAAARAAPRPVVPPPPAAAPPPTESPPVSGPAIWRDAPPSVMQTAPATIGGLEVTTVLGPAPLARAAATPESGASVESDAPTGDLSMEELIDLDQQAEFFIVLGQDEAAIELLAAYLRRPHGASPLPYLRLLEIHQRRGDEAAYEHTRNAFNHRFDAQAPEWSSDIHRGRSLDDSPQEVARLQALWPTPLHAMQALEALVFRREPGAETFDFPAYRELIFLYSIARELAGQVETDFGTIDLYLPLEDAPAPWGTVHPMAASDAARPGAYTVDLDVSGWPDVDAEKLVIRKSVGRR